MTTPSYIALIVGIAAFLGTLCALAFWAWIIERNRGLFGDMPDEYPVVRRPEDLP